MTCAVKAAEVAGQKPAIDDGFRRKFRLIQIAGHHGFASNGHFANAVSVGVHDAHFHPGERLANRVRAKRLQIVDRNGRARFRESVSIGDGNSEVVEKLQRLWFAEGAANNDGAQLSAKRFVHLLEQEAADAETRLVFRQHFVHANERIENSPFAPWQRVEARLQTFLQVFQNKRNETDISDLVFGKSFAHVFGTQGAQMYDRRAARERSQKTNHEINRMICWQDAEIAHAWPERIKRRERDALLQIIFVRHHATLRAAPCT